MATKGSLLVIEWSPTRVSIFDPIANSTTVGSSIADCLPAGGKGREAVVAISRRSAFVRTTFVPNASRSEIDGILRMQLEPILPFAPNEYVLGFRLGNFVEGKGRLAAIGAVKSDALEKISSETKLAGLRVRAIVPVAYGSWLAARSHGLADCAVVQQDGDSLSIDLVRDGELHYSRTVPLPDSTEDIEDEIGRTFAVSEVDTLPILSAGVPEIWADYREPDSTVGRLCDPVSLARLFSFESPAKTVAKSQRNAKWKASRAIAAAAVAAGMGGYAYSLRTRDLPKVSPEVSRLNESLRTARASQTAAQDRLDRIERANRILDVAFKPAQTMSDIVTVLSGAAGKSAWFTGLSVGRGSAINLTGLALNDKDVTAFLTSVSKDPRFEGMKVVSTNKTALADTPLTQFFVTGNPVGVLPFDRPLKEKRPDGKPKP